MYIKENFVPKEIVSQKESSTVSPSAKSEWKELPGWEGSEATRFQEGTDWKTSRNQLWYYGLMNVDLCNWGWIHMGCAHCLSIRFQKEKPSVLDGFEVVHTLMMKGILSQKTAFCECRNKEKTLYFSQQDTNTVDVKTLKTLALSPVPSTVTSAMSPSRKPIDSTFIKHYHMKMVYVFALRKTGMAVEKYKSTRSNRTILVRSPHAIAARPRRYKSCLYVQFVVSFPTFSFMNDITY